MSIQKINDPKYILRAIRELDRLGQEAFLNEYGYRKSRDYRIRYPAGSDKLYDSKAIVGVAYGYAFPKEGPLPASKFSGGKATVEKLLQDLGFEVISVDWSRQEVDATVRFYFEMLGHQNRGEPYNKADYNKRLRALLNNRSRGAVEQKHQNISAVLDKLKKPFITGYKPKGNIQRLLSEVVVEHLQRFEAELAGSTSIASEKVRPGAKPSLSALTKAPAPSAKRSRTASKPPRGARQVDFAAVDERNRALGASGEEWIVGYEKLRLQDEGRPDLAEQVRWVSKHDGDGAGYDILSFETSGAERYIEVKTTNQGPNAPFLISRNEKEFSDDHPTSFHLYRLYRFSTNPKVFILPGSLSDLELEAVSFRATPSVRRDD